MKDKPFQFKQFSVYHHRSSMKVGTDALLLGAWCGVENATHILEIGCGCGVISLMLAQRNSKAHILAIDIDLFSVEQANENFRSSPWADRLKATGQDFMEFDLTEHFDLMVCNPPFFYQSLESPLYPRNNARHMNKFDRALFFKKCHESSQPNSRIALIIPFVDYEQWIHFAAQYFWYPSKSLQVKDTVNKPSKRILIEFGKKKNCIQIETLIIKENKAFSPQYEQMLKHYQIIF